MGEPRYNSTAGSTEMTSFSNEHEVLVSLCWLDHLKLKNVRSAYLLETFRSVDGDLRGGAIYPMRMHKVFVRLS